MIYIANCRVPNTEYMQSFYLKCLESARGACTQIQSFVCVFFCSFSRLYDECTEITVKRRWCENGKTWIKFEFSWNSNHFFRNGKPLFNQHRELSHILFCFNFWVANTMIMLWVYLELKYFLRICTKAIAMDSSFKYFVNNNNWIKLLRLSNFLLLDPKIEISLVRKTRKTGF